MRAVNRRIRQRKGSANLARVKGYTMAMAYEVQQRALAAESEWEARVRADERERAHVHATGTSTGDGPCCECCYDVPAALRAEETERNMRLSAEAEIDGLRERIAADIEAMRPATRRTDRDVDASPLALAQRAYYDAMTDAARIARGES